MAPTHPVSSRELFAGRLRALYRDGALRYIRWRDIELLRHIYVAVRDENWGTIPIFVRNEIVRVTSDGFDISFTAIHERDDIVFTWRGTIRGTERRIEFEMDGSAGSSFLKNRIGVCVLHGATECEGLDCHVTHGDGSVTEGQFPLQVSPHQPFLDVRTIAYEPVEGVRASVHFEGEYFETEDQRNWTDDSFKTYSTPLREPMPVRVEKGHRVHHRVVVDLEGDALPVVEVLDEPAQPLPRIGFTAGSDVIGLQPHHLRVELGTTPMPAQTGFPLEVAISGDIPTELPSPDRVSHWLLYTPDAPATTQADLRRAKRTLQGKVGGGTRGNFADINRNRDCVEDSDVVCFSANPQVRGVDDLTIMETLAGQSAAVLSCRQFSNDKPVAVTPISFSPSPETRDPREGTDFHAAWILGSISSLAHAGAWSATYHLPENAPAVRRVFETVAAADQFTPTFSTEPRRIAALCLELADGKLLLLANLAAEPTEVLVEPGGERVALGAHAFAAVRLTS